MERTYTQRELDIEVKHAITQVLSHFGNEFMALSNEAYSSCMNITETKDLNKGYEQLGKQKAFNQARQMLAEKELEVLKSDLI